MRHEVRSFQNRLLARRASSTTSAQTQPLMITLERFKTIFEDRPQSPQLEKSPRRNWGLGQQSTNQSLPTIMRWPAAALRSFILGSTDDAAAKAGGNLIPSVRFVTRFSARFGPLSEPSC